MAETLRDLVEAELGQPVDPRVAAMAEAIAAKHGTASRAVLFYGSCLREKQLDGLMLDFYLIVSDYRSAYGKGWLATANTLVPPNVFPFQRGDLAAKYAVLSERDFYRLNGPETRNVSVWARFAQPSRLVWSADQAAAETAVAAVSRAAPTLLAAAGRVEGETALDWWRRAFSLTYSAELRAERKGRAGSVIDADLERYERFSPAVIAAIDPAIAGGGWLHRRIEGKLLSVLRLAKASATYAGGAEYIAWKINRHAGTSIELKPWQKRHPLLAAISLLPRLLRSGAIR
jgi:FAD/FMN-containing dehydrogenase